MLKVIEAAFQSAEDVYKRQSLDEPISQESDDMTLGDSVEDQTALEAFQGVEDRACLLYTSRCV